MTESQRRAKEKYRKKITRLMLELYPTEQDIIDRLFEQKNKSGYIKQLIRNDIEKSRE